MINLYTGTLQAFKKKPSVFTPFVIFAALEFLALMIIFLAPRMPLILVFGPPIRTFWGEKFLHYPANFLLLPKLASHSRMLLSIFAGSLLSGLAVSRLYEKPSKTAFKKYISLFLIVFIISILFYFSVKLIAILLTKYFMDHRRLLFLGARLWLGPISIVINLTLALLIQAPFVYAIPALIAGEEKFIKAILKSFVFFKKHFVTTLALAGLPMLIYIPIVILNYNTSLLIYKFFPEVILFVSLSSIVVSSLIVDPLITISTALFYRDKRQTI